MFKKIKQLVAVASFAVVSLFAPVARAEEVLPEPIVDCSQGTVIVKWGDIERKPGATLDVEYVNEHEGTTVGKHWDLPAQNVTLDTQATYVVKGEKINWTISALRAVSGQWAFKASVNCGPAATPTVVPTNTPEPTMAVTATPTPELTTTPEPTITVVAPTPIVPPTAVPGAQVCRCYLRAAAFDLTPVSVPVHFNGMYIGNTMTEEGRYVLLDVPCGSWNYLTVGDVNLSGMKLWGHSWMAPVQPTLPLCPVQ